MTTTKFCSNCSSKNITHEFQDKTYGKFMRIFNVSEDQKKMTCTVCGTKTEYK